MDYVTNEQEKKRTGQSDTTLNSPIGLGFRVPMVIASPWSKGGWVNSEVLDHTSTLQFLEHFVEKKFQKKILEENISPWRRLICGDLTSAFRPIQKEEHVPLDPVDRNQYVQRIYSARQKVAPSNFRPITKEQLQHFQQGRIAELLPRQEQGTKPACALPYDIEVNAHIDTGSQELVVRFSLGGHLPARKAMGVPLIARSYGDYDDGQNKAGIWNFAVNKEESLEYRWQLAHFKNGIYHIDIHGPNGFYRSFKGSCRQPKTDSIQVRQLKKQLSLQIDLDQSKHSYMLRDRSYGYGVLTDQISKSGALELDLQRSKGWYDLEVSSPDDASMLYRYAGHLENGQSSSTDPLMGYGK